MYDVVKVNRRCTTVTGCRLIWLLKLLIVAVVGFPTMSLACEKVKLSGDHDWPPFSWRQQNQIVGAATDIATHIFERLGVSVETAYVGPWKRVLLNAERGTLDFLNSAYQNDERKEYLLFVEPAYVRTPNVIYVKRGQSFEFIDWASLKGKRGVKSRGYSFGQTFDSYAAMQLSLLEVTSIIQSLAMLHLQRVDYFVAEQRSTELVIQQHDFSDKVQALEGSQFTRDNFMAFADASPCRVHLPAFTKILTEMITDGTVESVIEANRARWLRMQGSKISVNTTFDGRINR